jgi:potassium efflux system protein
VSGLFSSQAEYESLTAELEKPARRAKTTGHLELMAFAQKLQDIHTQLLQDKWRQLMDISRLVQGHALDSLVEYAPADERLKDLEAELNGIRQSRLEALSEDPRQLANVVQQLNTLQEQLREQKVLALCLKGLREIAHARFLAQLSWHQQWIQQGQSGWDVMKNALSFFNEPLFTLDDSPVTLLGLCKVVGIIVFALMLSGWLHTFLRKVSLKRGIQESTIFTMSRVIHYLIMTIATISALSNIGIDLTKLALVAGALSVGIGFGLQSIFSNFISGLILLFERPFKVGDLVELQSGVRGRIRAINVRSTQLNTRDNVDILVPNSEFINGRVVNYTFSDSERRVRIPFGVAYGSDKHRVKDVVLKVAGESPNTIRHKPIDVWLVALADSSLNFELVVWIDANKVADPDGTLADYLWRIESALVENHIEIPFPQRVVHMRPA